MNVNHKNREWNSCLHIAAAQGSLDILSILLQAGADVAAKNQKGKGAFDHAQEIKDEEKRAAVLALLAESSFLLPCPSHAKSK